MNWEKYLVSKVADVDDAFALLEQAIGGEGQLQYHELHAPLKALKEAVYQAVARSAVMKRRGRKDEDK